MVLSFLINSPYFTVRKSEEVFPSHIPNSIMSVLCLLSLVCSYMERILDLGLRRRARLQKKARFLPIFRVFIQEKLEMFVNLPSAPILLLDCCLQYSSTAEYSSLHDYNFCSAAPLFTTKVAQLVTSKTFQARGSNGLPNCVGSVHTSTDYETSLCFSRSVPSQQHEDEQFVIIMFLEEIGE